jgi:hypothetical protein
VTRSKLLAGNQQRRGFGGLRADAIVLTPVSASDSELAGNDLELETRASVGGLAQSLSFKTNSV